MAAGVSQASLKRELDALLKQIYEIDIKIQQFKSQQQNHHHIPNLEAAKVDIQRKIVDKQIQLELKKAQGKRRR